MRINELMALTESASGFVGGSYVDEMPMMSLDEAVNTLPVVIIESQMSFLESRNAQNEALVEATINAISAGYAPEYGPIVEMSFEDIKKKIKAFFDKILKFLRSIIAKLKLQIDKIRMSGKQLWEKYKDSKLLQGKKYDGLVYNGYDIMTKDKIFAEPSGFESNIGTLMSKAIGESFMSPDQFWGKYGGEIESGTKDDKTAKSIIDKLTNLSSADRAYNVAKELTGMKLAKDGWEADCRTKLYGEKIDIKHGQKGFDLGTLGKLLQDPADLTAIKDEYVRIEQAAKNYYSELVAGADKIQSDIDKANSDKEDKSAHVNALSLVSSYYNAYMSCVSDTYSVINKVKSLKYNYFKTRNDQAKAMFGKMLSWKDSKSNNNDASDAEDIGFILDFAM